MTTGELRCGSDILFENGSISTSHTTIASLISFSSSCNIVQFLKPLNRERPYFTTKILKLGNSGIVSVGLADSCLNTHVHPGYWSGSVAYFTNGSTVSSRYLDSPSKALSSRIAKQGDVIGVRIVHYGSNTSVVMFFLNGTPICTRYMYEAAHSSFLPTIGLENAPVKVEIKWPESFNNLPPLKLREASQWIRPINVEVNFHNLSFTLQNSNLNENYLLQAPSPLTEDVNYMEVECFSCNGPDYGPVIGVMSCDTHFPTPTSPCHKPFIVFDTGKQEYLRVMRGTRLGVGILSLPQQGYNGADKNRTQSCQMENVIVYFTLNEDIIMTVVCQQPVGGWYPFISLRCTDPEIRLIREAITPTRVRHLLDQVDIQEEVLQSSDIAEQERISRGLDKNNVIASDSIEITSSEYLTRFRLPPEVKGLHHVFYKYPLSAGLNTFMVRVRRLGEASRIYVGVASSCDLPWSIPGKAGGSVGYNSSPGTIENSGSTASHSDGHRYGQGDEITVFCRFVSRSVAILCFLRNSKPVATSFFDHTDNSSPLPVVALEANGSEILAEVIWQSCLAPNDAPHFVPTNLDQWCMSEGIVVDRSESMVYLSAGNKSAVSIMQCPVSMTGNFNHFEIELLDEIGPATPPPAICLCNASPKTSPPTSIYHKDFLRFWAIHEDCNIKRGDLVGFGVFHPQSNKTDIEEQLVLVYLTINRQMALVRALMQPPGGFFPVVLVPSNIEMVKFNFDAVYIRKEDLPLTDVQITHLLEKSEREMEKESGSSSRQGVEELDSLNFTLEDINRAISTGHEAKNSSDSREKSESEKGPSQRNVKSTTCDIL